jgi:hypothetical protein
MTMQAAAQFCFDDGPFPFAISVMIVVLLFGRKTRRILKPSYTTYAIVHLINGHYILQVLPSVIIAQFRPDHPSTPRSGPSRSIVFCHATALTQSRSRWWLSTVLLASAARRTIMGSASSCFGAPQKPLGSVLVMILSNSPIRDGVAQVMLLHHSRTMLLL